MRDGALYRGAERLIQHAAELHQRRTQLWVVAGGELCEESRRENNRERFVAAESECGEEAALGDAPAAVFIPDWNVNL